MMTHPFSLAGKRALVTGAGRGIGAACAAMLAEAGAEVTLTARSADELDETAGAIRRNGGAADTLPLDLTDLAAMRAALDARPAFDILVNNAGAARNQPFLTIDEANFDLVMGINVRAAFFCAQVVAKGMVAAGRGGAIINMSSQMGLVGGPDRTVYCASKHALEGMTKAMAIELGPHNIRVNTVCPTFIETELTRARLADPAFKDWVMGKIKLGRLGQPADIAAAVLYLASDAASLVTGTHLLVDGGWTAE
jgi:NAD(P)-dependent dehydrogenase (short-subunit alcohol dehydrogenase family)